MGSEQSAQTGTVPGASTVASSSSGALNSSNFRKISQHPGYGLSLDGANPRGSYPRPQRTLSDESLSTIASTDSRPVSPPISVCSDSDLPYISYTDKPIGDSPKHRNKSQITNKFIRASTLASDRYSLNQGSSSSNRNSSNISTRFRPGSGASARNSKAHNIVIVKAQPSGPDKDPELAKLQSIPQFLPVMRGTLSLPANRDPEVFERLQPIHLQNICSTLQSHFNYSANRIASDQNEIYQRIRKLDVDVEKMHQSHLESQKQYGQLVEGFSCIRQVSYQLTKCHSLLNQNIESLTLLNDLLPVEERLEPFVWKTDC